MFHFHKFEYLRDEYRLCKNPVFEQRIIIRQCVHCPKIDEWAEDTFRLTSRAVDGYTVRHTHVFSGGRCSCGYVVGDPRRR
jgi:hypothetical protein